MAREFKHPGGGLPSPKYGAVRDGQSYDSMMREQFLGFLEVWSRGFEEDGLPPPWSGGGLGDCKKTFRFVQFGFRV